MKKTIIPITAMMLGVAGLACGAKGADKVPLKTELPRPLFVGTPVPLNMPNLEPPRKKGEDRPPFMLPADAVGNVALGKEVTASDEWPVIGELEMATDEDKEGTDGSFFELGPGVQYVQIDLETAHDIAAILVWHFHAQPRVYHDVVVQVAEDPDFLSDVKTLYNNDHDNSAGLGRGKDRAYIEGYEGRLIDAKGAKGRYVRLYSNGNTSNEMNHLIEVEVFGAPST